jgi:hypothetical protein
MMDDLDAMIDQLRYCYGVADRRGPGGFRFVSSVMTINGPLVCAVVLCHDTAEDRAAAAKGISG